MAAQSAIVQFGCETYYLPERSVFFYPLAVPHSGCVTWLQPISAIEGLSSK
ncbi:hypothetical protein [Candidatus Vallotia lariciata]|uniref:hypothetical protein n=1 Tax=Candidatus Vallotia laricis TaxID=2018052 RepID=UPI001D001E08|nr:hypothetical protein [Candidatus Vallotia lariciata]